MSLGMSLVIDSSSRFDRIARVYAEFESRKSTESSSKLVARGIHLRAALMDSVFLTLIIIRGETTSGRWHAIGERTALPNARSGCRPAAHGERATASGGPGGAARATIS